MSSTVTVGTGSETIHGTYDLAVAHWALSFGSAADAITALSADNRKKCLATAVRFLNAQGWSEDADTFAERDAIAAFETAQYELAALIAEDPSVVSAADQGSNIASLSAGSASITYFNPTTDGADLLPPVLMRLIGDYLASSSGGVSVIGGFGNTGSCSSPFEADEDYDP